MDFKFQNIWPYYGFPSSSASKESGCNAVDPGSIPGLGRTPGEGVGLPTPVFWPGEFHGLYSPWGRKELDTTEWLSFTYSILSSRVHFFPFLCGQFPELWQLMSWVKCGHQVVNFSIWCFSIYKTAHRISLRIVSIALKKELKVLDYA